MPTRAASKRKRDSDEEAAAELTPQTKYKKRTRRGKRGSKSKRAREDSDEESQTGAEEAVKPVDKGKGRAETWGTSSSSLAKEAASSSTVEAAENDVPFGATAADPSPPSSTEDELARLKKELEHKEAMLRHHEAFAKQILQHVSCHICMEVVDDPLTLTCGHSFCKNCLWECFNRPVGDEAMAAEEDEQYATADEGERDQTTASESAAAPRRQARASSQDSDSSTQRAGSPRSTDGQAEPAGEPSPTDNPPVAGPSTGVAPAAVNIVENTIRLNAQRRQNLYCPSCRCRLYEPPFPVFGLRDLAHTVTEAMTIPQGVLFDPSSYTSQTTARPRPPKLSEDWNGLFAQMRSTRRNRGFRDEDDRVMRCLHCNWEIRDGYCGSCGAEYSEGEDEFGMPVESRLNGPLPGDRSESEERSDDEEDDGEMDDFIEADESVDTSQLSRMARRHRVYSEALAGIRRPRRVPHAPIEIVDSDDEEDDKDYGEDEEAIHGDEDAGEDGEGEEEDSFVRRHLMAGSSPQRHSGSSDEDGESDGSDGRAVIHEGDDSAEEQLSELEEAIEESGWSPLRPTRNDYSGSGEPATEDETEEEQPARRRFPPPFADHDAQASDSNSGTSEADDDDEEESPGPVVRRRAPRDASDSDNSPVHRRDSQNRRGGHLSAEVSSDGVMDAEHMSPANLRMMSMFRDRARQVAGEHVDEGSEEESEEDEGAGRFAELVDDEAEASEDGEETEDEDEEL